MTHNLAASTRAAIEEAKTILSAAGYRIAVRDGSKHTIMEIVGHERTGRMVLSRGQHAQPPEHTRRYARQFARRFLRKQGASMNLEARQA